MSGGPKRDHLFRYVSAGTEFTITFLAPLFGGLLLDRRLGSTPGFTILGGGAGFGVALYRLVKTAGRVRDSDAPHDRQDGGPA